MIGKVYFECFDLFPDESRCRTGCLSLKPVFLIRKAVCLSTIAGGAIAELPVFDTQPDGSNMQPLSRMQVLAAMGMTAIVLLIAATLWRRLGHVALLPGHPSLLDGLIGVGLGAGIAGASAIIYRTWPAYRESADIYLDLILRPLLLPDLIWLGLLPGLSEELLFRGVMLPALGMGITGLLLSSACFGVLHLSSLRHWAYMGWATLVGLLLGASVLVSGNLLVPIVAHASANFISGIAWKLTHRATA